MQKLTEQQTRSLKPLILKFNEFVDNIEKGDPKRIPRLLAEFEKSKFPSYSPPYVKTARAVIASKNNDEERAVILCREIYATKTSDGNICNNLIRILKQFNQVDLLSELYQKLIDENQNEIDPILWDLPFQIAIGNFTKAQELAMKFIALTKTKADEKEKENALIFAAACSYFRARVEKPMFYKFATKFIDTVKYKSADLAEIKINSLLYENPENKENFQNALNYVQTEEVKNLFSHNPLQYLRLEMKIQTALNNNEAVGSLAAKTLREINQDSLDEWKLAIKYYSEIDNLIKELDNGIFRGPQIAKIELAIFRKEDFIPSLLEYANKYADKNYLYGDIKPYLTSEVLPKLATVKNPIIQSLIQNKCVCNEINDELSTKIKSQDLIRNGEFDSLCEAVNLLGKYEKSADCRCTLIRVSGLLGATVAQNVFWTEQKLEAIQYLSLASFYLNDAIRSWDLITLQAMIKLSLIFCDKGIPSFISHINAALNNLNFLAIEMGVQFRSQIINNLAFYAIQIVQTWIKILDNVDEITPYKTEKFLTNEKIDQLEDRTDKSILPLYFNDEKLEKAFFPEIRQQIKLLSTVIRTLFALKLNTPEKTNEILAELEKISGGTQWTSFVEFVKGGCKSLTPIPANADIFLFGSLAIAAQISKASAETKGAIKQALTSAQEGLIQGLNLDKLPEIIAKSNEEQKKHILDAASKVENLLK